MNYKLVNLAIVVFLIIFGLHSITFAEDTVSDENEKSGDSTSVQEAVNRDSDLLKKLMMQTRSPDPEVKDVEFEVGNNPVEGSSSAQLMIVQFSDYSCHHCALYTKETFPGILKNYIEPGKLRYVVIDYPLPGNLPAIRAAEAVHCASEQGKFWEMHEEIMREQESLDDINSMASFINLDMEKFKVCMGSKKYEAIVGQNIILGTKLKIPSVPGFIIAKIDPGNPEKVKGITYIRGAKSFDYFQQQIESALTGLND